MESGLNEKCGVVGVCNTRNFDVARLAYLGLWSLQHRGQDSSGIASFDGRKLHSYTGRGLVSQVYEEKTFDKLQGQVAVGHNRYSTSGGDDEDLNQPYVYESLGFAFCHNGNLPYIDALTNYMAEHELVGADNNDSGLMAMALANELKSKKKLELALKECWPLFTGAFSCVGLYKKKLYGFRDSHGIRPLSIGKTDHGYVFASETAALDIIGADFIRDVKPGELVVADGEELTSYKIADGKEQIDALEFVYLARPDSRLLGQSVYSARRRAGDMLAKTQPVKADVVIGIPDSGIPAASGYARTSGIPFAQGLIKNRYIGRTFIEPEKIRKKSVELKFNIIVELVAGQDIVIIDDSLVRGNTLRYVIKILRESGAKSVHVRIAAPPIKFPDFYGIDTPTSAELTASENDNEEIRKQINADSLAFLDLESFKESTGVDKDRLCVSSFTGEYPIKVPFPFKGS